ncbi:zinc ribbon domain-containing protein [Streptomonospora salina]|uniref:Putative nucleic acid-binding Zn-ribbon protein n=1 Tax=Streptomonospora salina TaxID=104205 RepID=A0A841ELV3_9ACTN|nr:C4-type zinc ribbon domain-containing protein [Streptomonospora salina]MBB6001290.1 putative nucleic acid-binding Zn-ribbon protein [Streptomonospora salina]
MKAEPAHQVRLLDLQETDSRIAQLAHRLRTLPENEEVRRLDARIGGLRDTHTSLTTALSDLDREQRKAESDVDQVRTRAERDAKRLDSGQVGSPKDLEHLQSEIASLQRRQTELEEIVLEVMERREGLESRERQARTELEQAEAERDAVEERRATAVGGIEADRATEATRRERIAGELPEDLLAFYTKLRDQNEGVGAAALRYGRCEGCKLALSTAELSEIRQTPAEEVVRCEQCRRILVRTTDSGI